MATLNSALRISSTTKTEIDYLVQRVARRIAQAANFLDVRASPQDWPAGQPDYLSGARPHISALEWKSMKWREAMWFVMTAEALVSNQTRQACQALARRAAQLEGSFYLVAPVTLAAKVKEWADRHHIQVSSFWVFNE
jgi:hypothetical protein